MIAIYITGYIGAILGYTILSYHTYLSRSTRLYLCASLALLWPAALLFFISVGIVWLIDFIYHFVLEIFGLTLNLKQESDHERIDRILEENNSLLNQIIRGRDFEDKNFLLFIIRGNGLAKKKDGEAG